MTDPSFSFRTTARLLSYGSWEHIPKWGRSFLSDKEAILLSLLMNLEFQLQDKNRIPPGEKMIQPGDWFLCSEGYITSSMEISLSSHYRLLKQLSKKNLIKIKKEKSKHPRRMIRLLWKNIAKNIERSNRNSPEKISYSNTCQNDRYKLKKRTEKNRHVINVLLHNTNNICRSSKNSDGSCRNLDKTLATFLRSKLSKKRKLIGNSSVLKNWANSFRLLRKEVGEEDLIEVLEWYCSHVGEEFVPVAYSASSFRNKFVRIQDAMNRSRKRKQSKPSFSFSPKERKEITHILTYLSSTLNWPKDSSKELPFLIEEAFFIYRNFRTKLYKMKIGLVRCPAPKKRIVQIIYDLLPSTSSFVREWCEQGHSRIANWDEWSGNVNMLRFSLDHKLFAKQCKSLLSSLGRNKPDQDWKDIQELVF